MELNTLRNCAVKVENKMEVNILYLYASVHILIQIFVQMFIS